MKKIKILLIALILVLGGVFFSNAYAAKGDTRSLGASLTRPFVDSEFTNPKYQYTVPGNTTDLLYTIVKIYDNNDKVEDILAYTKALYCLRGGIGFGSEDVSTDPVTYTEIGEMHTDAKTIIETYMNKYKTGNETGKEINIDTEKQFTISKTENGVPTQETKTVNLYNAILWIIDEAYLPVDKTTTEGEETVVLYDASEYKKELLDKAGVPTSQQADITDNDIEVIQQLAMWYFTNYDEQLYNKENPTQTIPTVSQNRMFPAQFLSINGGNNIDDQRANNLDRLYQYFVYGAIENADSYEINATTNARTKTVEENKFDKTNTLSITSPNIGGDYDYYEIGPIKFEGNSGDRKTVNASNIVLYDAEDNVIAKEFEIPVQDEWPDENGDTVYGEITSGGKHIVYKFLDSDGNEVTDLIKGQEYKVRIYKAFEEKADVLPDDLYERYDMSKFTVKVTTAYSKIKATFLSAGNESQPVVEIDKEERIDSDEITTEDPKEFDLSLRKYISSIKRDGEEVEIEDRTPSPNVEKLNTVDRNVKITTADYNHRKNPVEVKTGDIVTYKITIYNEGEIAGRATKIVDQLPTGLKFTKIVSGNYELDSYDVETNKLSLKEKSDNSNLDAYNEETKELKSTTIEIECEVTEQVGEKDKILTNIAWISEAYNAETNETIISQNGADRDSEPGTTPSKTADELRTDNIGYTGKDNHAANELSSNTYFEGQQDDDDFEKIIIKGKEFDLSLRKFISAINGIEPETSRVPQIDTSMLNKTDTTTGEEITTATYVHSKEPLTVKKGDIVTYKIRIYNEGDRDGYATRVTDYLPDGLGFLFTDTGDINSDWFLTGEVDSSPLYGANGIYASEDEILKKEAYKELFGEDIELSKIQVIQGSENEDGSRNMLSVTAGGTIGQIEIEATEEIKAYGSEVEEGDLWQQSTNSENDGLFYQELEITCIVLKENTYPGILKNVAEITAAKDSEGNEIKNIGDDRDSEPNNVYEDQNHTPNAEVDGYTPGEQDDDDYEPVVLRYFDLALRKFITGVESNGELTEVTSRIPELSINEETENIEYTHPKEEAPVEVANNDIVIYTLRVYNEGTLAGYAEEITDDIPEGLIYLPEHDVNKQYEWKMFDKDGNATDNLEDAYTIKTEYLSKAKETDTRNNLIEAFDSSKELGVENPDYKDIKVAFRVMEPNTSDRIIVNSAQISEDSDDDEDSDPGEWNDGEDDQDKEYIYVKYFDLSLLKWVTQTIVTVDGKTTTTETGFKPNTGLTETTGIRDNDENEPVAKVELDKNKLSKTTVKFAYKIRVTNEGEIAGYATEITDFIPEGLEFKAEDNKKYGWVKEGDDKVTTRALETVLLQPGESAELEIVFTWKNDKNNLGVKTNIAEITEDYNEHNSEDIDSTPENKKDPYEKEQEDDDDFALVVLSLKTGKGASYTILITTVITMLAGGIYLIKKYVLTY